MATAIAAGCATSLMGQEQETIQELEAFITEQTANEPIDSLLPTEQFVSGAFMDGMSLFETPRAVTVLSPELLEQFNITDFNDLSKYGASTERANFYGIAGAPVLRGWQGGIYYNGMLRAFQRNEMPTSFGALDAMEIVKGPAPAHLMPSHVGGYVNMVPKAPYFDEFRGSVEVEVGTYDHYKGQVDVGGPIYIADSIPAAYRVSLTAQDSDSYYNGVSNDFVSVYASAKLQLSDSTMLTIGGEFFEFKSNENAGWNRPTQNLIDNSQYVIGEPLSLVRSDIGIADRGALDSVVFGFSGLTSEQNQWFRSLVVPQAVVDSAVANGDISAAQRSTMLNLGDAATRAAVYNGLSSDYVQTTSGYLYTSDYFDAGGTVFTTELDGRDVLADPTDFADSEDIILFADLKHTLSADTFITYDLFFEKLETTKFSSYGYAFDSEQEVFDNRLAVNHSLEADWFAVDFSIGGQLRYTDAKQLQDFWTEPFSRGDISTPGISANSKILAGADVDPNTGRDFWIPGFAAGSVGLSAVQSDLSQVGAFAMANFGFGDHFNLLASVRWDEYDYESTVPGGISNTSDARNEGGESNESWALNPSVKINEHVTIYGALQESATYIPTQAGVVVSDDNFGQGELKEIGAKFMALEGKLFASVAFFEWEQAAFNERTSIKEDFISKGVEVELTYQITENVTLIGAFTDRETKYATPLNLFRTRFLGDYDPLGQGDAERGFALEGGRLVAFEVESETPANNPDLNANGVPETTFKLFAVVEDFLIEGFGFSGGFVYSDAYYHNFDQTLRIPSSTVASANVFYRRPEWEILLGVDNLTDEDYFTGSEPGFGANTLITKAPGIEARLSFKYKF